MWLCDLELLPLPNLSLLPPCILCWTPRHLLTITGSYFAFVTISWPRDGFLHVSWMNDYQRTWVLLVNMLISPPSSQGLTLRSWLGEETEGQTPHRPHVLRVPACQWPDLNIHKVEREKPSRRWVQVPSRGPWSPSWSLSFSWPPVLLVILIEDSGWK